MERDDARASPASRSTTPIDATATTRAMRRADRARTSTSSANDDAIKVVLLRGRAASSATGADMGNAYSLVQGKPDADGEPTATVTAGDPAAEPAAAAHRRPQDVRLLPQLPRLPEGDRRRGARLRARRRVRDGADGRHLRRRPRHEGRDAGHALPRAGARIAAHVLLPARSRPGRAACCSPATRSPASKLEHSASSPRSSTTPTSRRGRAGGPKGRAHARRRHRHRQGGLPARRAAAGYQGEEVVSYLFHAYGTNLQFDEDEFNFVKIRAQHGTKQAFELCNEHFEVPEP